MNLYSRLSHMLPAQWTMLDALEVLAALGARAVTLKAVGALRDNATTALYKRHNSGPSPSGQTPKSVDYYFSTFHIHTHSTLLSILFASQNSQQSHGVRFIRAYALYRLAFAPNVAFSLDPERAYNLVNLLRDSGQQRRDSHDALVLLPCRNCNGPALSQRYKTKHTCMLCSRKDLSVKEATKAPVLESISAKPTQVARPPKSQKASAALHSSDDTIVATTLAARQCAIR
jgi:hypothetical protein